MLAPALAPQKQDLREQIPFKLGFREGVQESLGSIAGDIPRGALTEIAGPASSGRTALLYSLLASMTARQEFCALLDVEDSFDPESAAAAGVRLSQLLWVRCGSAHGDGPLRNPHQNNNVERALKAADMLAQGGGFGLVAIDLGNIPPQVARRIPLAAWFRLRRGVENTRTALVVVAQQIYARSCSALKIALGRNRTLWRGRLPGCLLDGIEVEAHCIRNHRGQGRNFVIRR